jgi:phytoene dehydrogenase-like protein
MSKKVITVIGGGWAGLAAAAFAARSGARVKVLEARSELGGRARTNRVDGFFLNQGAHALYASSEGSRVLADLDIVPRGNKPPLRGYGRLRGKVGLMPGTPMDSLRSPMIDLRTKYHLGKLLASPRRALKTDQQDRSMQDWINEQTADEDARLILAMAARTATYQGDMSSIAACVGVPQTIGALTDGVIYLDGGWQQITNALRATAERFGAKISAGEKIETIKEVESDCDAVIIATGGARNVASLLGDRSMVVQQWAEHAQPVYAACLDLGLRSLPIPERRFCLGVDDPLYLSTHTPSARLAPNGGEVVHVIRYDTGDDTRDNTPGDTTDGQCDPRAEMEQFLDAVQPGWRSHVIAEQFGRRLIVASDRPSPQQGELSSRPGPSIPDCPNVYVAGDWVGAHGLLADAALASGRDAARAALAH